MTRLVDKMLRRGILVLVMAYGGLPYDSHVSIARTAMASNAASAITSATQPLTEPTLSQTRAREAMSVHRKEDTDEAWLNLVADDMVALVANQRPPVSQRRIDALVAAIEACGALHTTTTNRHVLVKELHRQQFLHEISRFLKHAEDEEGTSEKVVSQIKRALEERRDDLLAANPAMEDEVRRAYESVLRTAMNQHFDRFLPSYKRPIADDNFAKVREAWRKDPRFSREPGRTLTPGFKAFSECLAMGLADTFGAQGGRPEVPKSKAFVEAHTRYASGMRSIREYERVQDEIEFRRAIERTRPK